MLQVFFARSFPPHIYQWNSSKMCAIILTPFFTTYLITNPNSDLNYGQNIDITPNRPVIPYKISSVQFSRSVVSDFAPPWTAARQASQSITNFQSLPKPMSTELVLPSNHLTLCNLLLILPSVFPITRVFSSESAHLIMWSKYCSFKFSIRPSIEYSGLICFRIDWFDLSAIQGTLF